MQDEIRKSGITAIGDIPWGAHFCQLYQTKQDLIDILVPFFKTGLENNEFCMWVTADNLTAEEARQAMTKAIKGFSTYIKKGQIEIFPYTEWYLKDGSFKSQNVLDGWVEKLNQALKKGYAGLRLTGNTFWLKKKDWHNFTAYEETFDNVIGKYKMIALSTYSLKKCSTVEIMDVIRNHEFALIKRAGKWELFENSRCKAPKEDLSENEKRFQLALKNAPVTIAVQDNDLRFLWAYNQRTVRPENVLGKTDFEVFSNTDAEKLVSLKRRVLQTGESLNEKMWLTSNGKKVYLDIFLEPLKDQNGKIIGVEVTTVDLSRQKLVEEALHENEENYRKLFEGMSEGLAHCEMIYDESGKPVDYCFLDINVVFEQFIGLPKEQIIGKTVRVILPKVQLKAIKIFGKVVSNGKPVNFENHSRDLNKWFDVFSYKTRAGQFAYMVIDITARKLTEQALKESEERFKAIASNTPDHILVQDNDLRYTFVVNPQLGLTEKDMVGKTDYDILKKADADNLTKIKRQVIESGKPLHLETSLGNLKDGKDYFSGSYVPQFNEEGKIDGIIGYFQKITERKKAEEELKESQRTLEEAQQIAKLGSWEWNTGTGELRWSQELYAIYGVKPESFTPTMELFGGFVHPDDRESLNRVMNQLTSGGEAVNIDFRIILHDNSVRYLHATSKVKTCDNTGKPFIYVGTTQDISERKKIENDIFRMNRELQAIRECDQMIVHSTDETALLTDVCGILCTTAGYRLAWIGSVEHNEEKSIRPLVWHGDGEYLASANITWADTERGRGPTGFAVRTGNIHFFQDFAIDSDAEPWRKAALSRGYRSSIAIPLKDNYGSVFAVLSLYSSEPNSFNPAEIRLLEELVNDLAFGIAALREKAERKRIEAELVHLSSFPELNPNPILELDLHGKIKYLNSAAKAELPDLLTLGIKHPFMVDGSALAQELRSDPSRVITREVAIGESWYEQTLMFVPSVKTYRLYARNITLRKKAEDILKESEEHSRLILATTLDGVWINDLSGRLLYVNDAYCHMIGYSREELLKMYIHDIEAKENQEETIAHINKIIRRGGDIFETRHKHKDGRIIDIEISAKYTSYGNGQLIVFARDITERKKSEEALKESEERFSKAFHDSPVALSISRISDGIFIDVNEAFIHLFGYDREELIGQKAIELNIYTNPVDRQEIVRLLQQQKKVVNYKVIARTKNGSEIKILTSAEKIEINGQANIIWTSLDITEREQAEDLLRETSNYLNNLLDYANAPIIVWDTHFRISRFNPAFERLTGYKSQEVIGLDLDILFPENKKTESLQQIARTLSGERWEVVEIPVLRIDGEVRTVLWNSANVYDNDGKQIIATIAQGQDVTESKKAADALKTSEIKYRRLFEAAKDGILLIDAETGLILDVNPFLIEMLGLPKKEFLGKNLWELGYFRDIIASKANFLELQKNEYVRYEDLPLRTADGREMKVEFVSNLYEFDHQKIIQCNVRDITKRKQAEEEVKRLNEITKRRAAELEVANKELEAFAYSVSHDLRAPLRSMEGFSQVLLEDCTGILNDECKDYLKRIQSSAELMAQLINDMLRLSRITRADMHLDDVNLSELAQSIASDLKKLQPERRVEFVITPGLIGRGDEKLLRVALTNLLENSWKFTGNVPETHIEFGIIEKDGKKAYFVRDNGAGFDMTYADKLFKPFQRLHTYIEFPGTGIGLASVQRIIQRHSGQVWAEGKIGGGATFYFTLG